MSAARTTIITIVGVGCIAAAGVGGFVAQRLNSEATEAAPAQAVAVPVPAASQSSGSQAATKSTDARQAPPVERDTRAIGIASSPAPGAPQGAEATASRPGSPYVSAARGSSVSTQPAVESAGGTAVDAPVTMSASGSTNATLEPVVLSATQPDPPTAAAESAKPQFDELTLKEESVIGIRLDTTLSTETARLEDRVTARVARDVTVEGRIAIPSGARLEGTVTMVERGGKFRERARLGVRFHAIVLTDNSRIPIQTETIYRDGESPTGDASAKVGASAVIGGILGAVIGGKKGAAIGTAAGAVGGTAAVMASGSNDATLAAGTPLTVRLTSPATILVSRDQE